MKRKALVAVLKAKWAMNDNVKSREPSSTQPLNLDLISEERNTYKTVSQNMFFVGAACHTRITKRSCKTLHFLIKWSALYNSLDARRPSDQRS